MDGRLGSLALDGSHGHPSEQCSKHLCYSILDYYLVGSKKACGSRHRISHENWKKEKTNKKTKRTKTQKKTLFFGKILNNIL